MFKKNSIIEIIFSLFFLAIFLFIATNFDNNSVNNIDFKVWYYINDIRSDFLNKVISNFTHLGDTYFLVFLVAIVVLVLIFKYKYYREAIWLIITTFLGAAILNKLLKNYYARPRPFVDNIITNVVDATGYSFPSGHSMGSIIVYLSIAYIISNKVENYNIKGLVYFFSITFSILICLSRVYLGVHYPTDVIAGYFLGLSWVIFAVFVGNMLKNKKEGIK